MPIYEYKCHQCGKKFEVRQRISAEPLKTHPECGGEVERLISAPALVFKGTGWYVTDYGRNGASSSTAGSNAQSETKSEPKKSESAGETKSETKKESKSPATPAA